MEDLEALEIQNNIIVFMGSIKTLAQIGPQKKIYKQAPFNSKETLTKSNQNMVTLSQ